MVALVLLSTFIAPAFAFTEYLRTHARRYGGNDVVNYAWGVSGSANYKIRFQCATGPHIGRLYAVTSGFSNGVSGVGTILAGVINSGCAINQLQGTSTFVVIELQLIAYPISGGVVKVVTVFTFSK